MMRKVLVLAGLFLALLVVIACDRPPPVQSTSENSVTDDRPGSDEGDETGERCTIDDQCQSFYRCINRECTVPPAITGEANSETPRALIRGENGPVLAQFHLELAVTNQQRARGLMYREEMRDEWGMLFVYPREDELSFWMKNTLIPLDMIFLDATGKVVGVVHEAEPETLSPRSVGRPARYVLEINGGLAEKYGIDQGAEMSLSNVDDRYQTSQ